MNKQAEPVQMPKHHNNNDPDSGYGKSGGNMGAGKSGKEDMGTEKATDDNRMGSEKHQTDGSDNNDKRSQDDTDDARGGGSNQNRDKGGVEMDATGGRRAKGNDDEDKYNGRGGKNSDKSS